MFICIFRILCYSTSTWYFCHHGKITTHSQFFGGIDCLNINRESKLLKKNSNNSLIWYYLFNLQSLIIGDVIYAQILGKSAAGLLLKVLCNCSDSPRVVTELGVKVYVDIIYWYLIFLKILYISILYFIYIFLIKFMYILFIRHWY